MSGPRIELHIDELVLRGFSRAERFRVAEALQGELSRLLKERKPGNRSLRAASIERLNAGSIQVVAGAKPAAIGAQVGQSVFRQIAPALGLRQPLWQQRNGRK